MENYISSLLIIENIGSFVLISVVIIFEWEKTIQHGEKMLNHTPSTSGSEGGKINQIIVKDVGEQIVF